MSSERKRGCLYVALVAAGILVALAAVYTLAALRMPQDAPLARMYRTEADIAFLAHAVEAYRAETGAYPPAGRDGLQLATKRLSRAADYVPDGPPPDAWGHPYIYVPNTQYAEPGSQAMRCGGGYCAPDTFQIYSMGSDGDAGLDDTARQSDNITSWDSAKSWRAAYRK